MRTLFAAFLLFLCGLANIPAFAQSPAPNQQVTTTTVAPASGVTVTPAPAPSSGGTVPPAVDPAPVQGQGAGEPSVVGESGEALVKLFVLAVLLESALALIFNWRPFVVVFDGRGVKSILSFLAAWLVVGSLRPESISELMEGYGSTLTETGRDVATILEAMIVAGGSAGVNNMLRTLGFRSRDRVDQIAPTPPKDEAWVSVALVRRQAVGPVDVELEADNVKQVAGTIRGRVRKKGLLSYFVRDYARFPPSGGYTLTPGKAYTIRLKGRNSAGEVITSTSAWGPHALAKRAVVDIELEL